MADEKMYYEATEYFGRYRARIYDENGANVYLSKEDFETEGDACDAAVNYAEDNDLEVEMG